MDIRPALTGQFRAGLAMLRECVELCPDELWGAILEKPPRAFWRIAYHASFYTHFYLSPNQDSFNHWEKHVPHAVMTFADEGRELPPEGIVYSRQEMIEYINWISGQMESMLALLDLESLESGFPWYKNFPKLDHVLLTLRHLGVHVGQLQEILFERSIDPDWISRR